jgi:glycosyltransferase involved in cell wall biosynthesis
MEKELLLSVCIITYNQEKYIRNTIEGVLLQKTDFNVELIIGEDSSTDKTRQICQEYSKLYPDKINILPSNKNLGAIPNFVRTLIACRGKYIAICEGDDYWTDRFKLQKQVDILEKETEYSLCFHNALIKYEGIKGEDKLFCEGTIPKTSAIEDVIESWYIPTASMVFRSSLIFPLPYWFKEIYNGDYALQLLLSLKGKFYFINQVMSVYRQHSTNLSSTVDGLKINMNLIQLYKLFNKHTNYAYKKRINNKIAYLTFYSILYRIKYCLIKYSLGSYFWRMLSSIFKVFKKV